MAQKGILFPPDYIYDAQSIGYTIRSDDFLIKEEVEQEVANEPKEHEFTRFFLDTSPASPIGLRADVMKTEPMHQSMWGYIRTTSWAFDGERSDLHDLISSIVAISLRHSCVSTSLPTQSHPLDEMFSPTEIYSRFVSFERNRLFSFEPSSENLNLILEILFSTFYAAALMDHVFFYTSPHLPAWGDFEAKSKQIATFLDNGYDSDIHNFMARNKPSWGWFRSLHSGISVFDFDESIMTAFKNCFQGALSPQILTGVKRKVILTEGLGNAISMDKFEIGQSLLEFLGDDCKNVSIVPIEDRFFLLGNKHIISLDDNCGEEGYKEELQLIRLRNEQERSILFPVSNFVWQDNIDGERFERFIRDLLVQEPEVHRVRRVSGGNEGDGGRDLEVEWMFVNKFPTTPDDPPYHLKTILVQCKAYKRSVNKENVRDIRDTIDMHNADGYHLVVSSQLTTQLFDYLSSLRKKGLQIDWWTRDDIEDESVKYFV